MVLLIIWIVNVVAYNYQELINFFNVYLWIRKMLDELELVLIRKFIIWYFIVKILFQLELNYCTSNIKKMRANPAWPWAGNTSMPIILNTFGCRMFSIQTEFITVVLLLNWVAPIMLMRYNLLFTLKSIHYFSNVSSPKRHEWRLPLHVTCLNR